MTYPLPPASPSPAQSGVQRNQLTPLWMLLLALALLVAGAALLLARPVGQWAAALQPTQTPTPTFTPTLTLTPTPVPTRTPTRTPTLVPTEALSRPRSRPLFDKAADLRSIQMFDSLQGWGVGQFSVYSTRDGGQTWEDVTPAEVIPRLPGGAAFFLDSQRAWYFDSNGAVNFSGRLYYTADGGRTWTSRATWFGGEDPRLFFLESFTGWVLTSSYNFTRELYRTSNNGIDWAAYHRVARTQEGRSGFLPDTGFLRGPVFRTTERGWIGGTTRIEAGTSFIYESTDGGRLWLPHPLPMEAGYASMWISAPRFFHPREDQAVMVAYAAPITEIIEAQGIFNENQLGVTPVDLPGARYVFFATADGGENWEAIAWVKIANPSPYSLMDPEHFFVLDGLTLRYTRDAGQTWQALETGLEQWGGQYVQMTGLQFVSEQVGWAWGLDGDRLHLYKTSDGGSSWEEMDLQR